MTSATSPIILKWDPKSLEIRTLTVERLLEPLVTQVTTLVNTSNKGPSGKKKGRSKKAHVLAASVEQATQNFLEKGEQIAKESQDLKEELVAAVEDVRKQGETMRIASSEFADDPCSSVKRGTMVRAARALLSAVTRLLILADMADVMRLLSHLKIVEEALEAVKNATNEQDLANRFKEFGKEMVKLNYVAARRQQELKDPHCRDEMAAARGALKKNATMLYTASQAFLRHPDVAATRANRDYVFKQVQEAIAGISNAAQATSPTDEAKGHTGIGELAAALNEFDNKIILDPMTFSEARFRPSLEERLESIISGAALMADSSCTRDDRRERIVAECNAVRQALQDLLSEYMNNLDSATSLIQAAKNLMNAVVLTVKASYVASTKYQKVYGTAAVNSPVVSWKMKAPEKKPLVKREKPEEFQTRVRRGSQKKHISPVQALSEFKAMDSF
ncbi:TPA: catenin, alpha 2 [Bos taurus]|uniref:Catenin alpha-2 n=1 Tax=Bos taurus TaxID=9913 RepID=A6QPC5_BOVIN|nr:CTNNA2 protein [Bos taurus]DAA24595.1 TPA: catenin, alpha 2 [Bos taurus]